MIQGVAGPLEQPEVSSDQFVPLKESIMNIFVVNTNPIIAARDLCDKHVVKMITESVQLLSWAMISIGLEGPYKKSDRHWNHPCTKWTRETFENYYWLYRHADELGKEYTRRYGKYHLAHKKLHDDVPIWIDLPEFGLTPFANCTPYKDAGDIVEAYRKFYVFEKSKFAKWQKGSSAPYWYVNKVF